MTTQDPELSAALGWPGGISDPVLDRKVLLQMVAALRLASQQALEALEDLADCGAEAWSEQRPCVQIGREAITALRAALAQQAEPVEPVAWRTFDGEGGYDYRTYADNENYAAEWAQRNPRHVGWVEPLYTAPPQRKQAEPLNLADPAVQKRLATQWGYVPAAQAEPVQDQRCRAEPRSDGDFVCDCKIGECPGRSAALAQQAEPVEQLAELQAMLRAEVDRLIAAGIQPQRKPLTEEEIERIGMKHVTLREVIRAVERAHGIKE